MRQPMTWTLPEVLARVDINENGCWIWRQSKTQDGYGRTHLNGWTGMAHTIAYRMRVGPIPNGMQLDHLCHTAVAATCQDGKDCPHRACVNPAHLEPVTPQENSRRSAPAQRSHCPQGHPYEGWNLITDDKGRRKCRACMAERTRRWEERAGYVKPKPKSAKLPRHPCKGCGKTTQSIKSICRTCWRSIRSAA